MRIWSILNSKLVLVLLTFFLTGIVGTHINTKYQQATWDRQQRFERLQRRIADETQFVDRLSDLYDKRKFGLRRVVWEAETGDPLSTSRRWDDYYGSVVEWNLALNSNARKIRRLGGDQVKSVFLDKSDEQHLDRATSLHYKIAYAHDQVLALRTCVIKKSCAQSSQMVEDAHRRLDEIDQSADAFFDRLAGLLARAEAANAPIISNVD